jgi:hypothetical protein
MQNPSSETDISRQGGTNINVLLCIVATLMAAVGVLGGQGIMTTLLALQLMREQKPNGKPTTVYFLLCSTTGTIHKKLLWVRILISFKLTRTQIKNINDHYRVSRNAWRTD